ncbi:uncharacterized protein LOC143267367 [Peromyscus maniculatus bairdii]|uniref:uncharacterized protein LOC143267367 n=1 Tax=Peromyscus maniculatus bairdii TaxID=230844 RepID=UPI003FD5B03B
MTYYQALLLDSDRVNFGPTVSLNPATLLPLPSPSEKHDCLQILAEAHGTRPDLTDQPLKDPDAVWYTDGSSFLEEGERRAGAAITTESEVVWASSLPPGTSAQRTELIALTQALRMAEGKKLTVYTDSRYAFATAHVHGEIYRRRGLLTSAGKEIKNKKEILDLLKALFLPLQLSIVHCPGHQKDDSAVARGNRLADLTARTVASQPAGNSQLMAIQEPQPERDPVPYSPEDHELAKKMGADWEQRRQAYILGDRMVMPTSHTRYMLRFLHALTHLSKNKMKTLLDRENTWTVLLNQDQVLQQVTSTCPACVQVNAGKVHLNKGARQRGHRPGVHWEIDFTEVKPRLYGYRYLLVFVDTFSGWIEAFPTKNETANVVTKELLEEIFPRGTSSSPPVGAEGDLEAPGQGLSGAARQAGGAPPLPDRGLRLGLTTPDQEPGITVEGALHCLADHPHCTQGRRDCWIAAWIHASHVKAAREPDPAGSRKSTWTVRRTRNPLKIRLARGSSSSPSS